MTFRAVSERAVYDGYVIKVRVGTFSSPDGSTFERDVVHHPGAVAIAPIDDDHITLVQQYRPALDRLMIEIPAGLRDVEGEPLLETAKRELVEEVGLTADYWEPMVTVHNSVGFCDEEIHLFTATGLAKVERTVTDSPEEVDMEILRVPLGEAREWIASGRITDVKTIVAVLHHSIPHGQ